MKARRATFGPDPILISSPAAAWQPLSTLKQIPWRNSISSLKIQNLIRLRTLEILLSLYYIDFHNADYFIYR